VLAVPISALSGHPDNPRKHPEANKRAIAGSLKRYMQRKPVVVNLTPEGLRLEAGHGVYGEMLAAGSEYIACTIVEDDPVTELGFMLADNRSGDLSEDDPEKLAPILRQLLDAGEDVEEIGWDEAAVRALLAEASDEGGPFGSGGDEDGDGGDDRDAPVDRAAELQTQWGTARGQVWEIPSKTVPGKCHRVVCGDSTVAGDVSLLLGGISEISLLHADPPYGMGKESDGVANDNLYRERLDAFQMSWWRTWRPFLADNASAYIWGNAPELWRLWYVGGLAASERLTLRNEIVWDKGSNPGMSSDALRCYSPAGNERCLFFVLGEQGYNNNADNYWEGWEPVRCYLEGQRVLSRLSNADCNRVCGKQNVTQSAFTKGGFRLILQEDYEKLRQACGGIAFRREYDDLKREYDDLKRAFYSTRAYFDNTHDNMTDVWEFPRVVGDDRHNHATPKPVEMMQRIIKSSCPPESVVAEPFLGSGTTLVAAELEGRICCGCELTPAYVAVILQRCKDAGLEPRRV
jgi:DNA modification methylase